MRLRPRLASPRLASPRLRRRHWEEAVVVLLVAAATATAAAAAAAAAAVVPMRPDVERLSPRTARRACVRTRHATTATALKACELLYPYRKGQRRCFCHVHDRRQGWATGCAVD